LIIIIIPRHMLMKP